MYLFVRNNFLPRSALVHLSFFSYFANQRTQFWKLLKLLQSEEWYNTAVFILIDFERALYPDHQIFIDGFYDKLLLADSLSQNDLKIAQKFLFFQRPLCSKLFTLRAYKTFDIWIVDFYKETVKVWSFELQLKEFHIVGARGHFPLYYLYIKQNINLFSAN